MRMPALFFCSLGANLNESEMSALAACVCVRITSTPFITSSFFFRALLAASVVRNSYDL